MNRNPASLALAVADTVDRVRRGDSPFSAGSVEETDMAAAAYFFTDNVSHEEFFRGIESRFTRGEDPSEWIAGYLSAVFAQGFASGMMYAKEEE